MMDIPRDLSEYKSVLKRATQPSWDDFWRTATIAAVGVGLVGAIGFTIFLIMSFVPA